MVILLWHLHAAAPWSDSAEDPEVETDAGAVPRCSLFSAPINQLSGSCVALHRHLKDDPDKCQH